MDSRPSVGPGDDDPWADTPPADATASTTDTKHHRIAPRRAAPIRASADSRICSSWVWTTAGRVVARGEEYHSEMYSNANRWSGEGSQSSEPYVSRNSSCPRCRRGPRRQLLF